MIIITNKTINKTIEYDSFEFSGGEVHIKIERNSPINNCSISIAARIENSLELIKLLMIKNALEVYNPREISLYLPYLPYARQDRRCDEGEAFSLKVFCELINNMKFKTVYVLDCHSDVGVALLNNCINISNMTFVDDINLKNKRDHILISPDAGANKKINKLAQELEFKRVVKCDKKRDLETGQLTGFEVFADNLEGKDCLIVDDICDGGGTFNGLAQELKKKGAGKLYLAVTHGIFSQGFEKLAENFEKIYCTNSIKDINNPLVEQQIIL